MDNLYKPRNIQSPSFPLLNVQHFFVCTRGDRIIARLAFWSIGVVNDEAEEILLKFYEEKCLIK